MASLSSTAIYKLVILSFTVPLYTYGIYQWITNRRLFIIANRFPAISYLITCGAFILLLSSLIGDILYDFKIADDKTFEIFKFIKISCTFSLCALSTSRTFLIYLQYQIQQHLSTNQCVLFNEQNTTIQSTPHPKHPTKHIIFKLMIIYTIIGAIMITCTYWIGFWIIPVFLSSLGVIIVIISIIMFKKNVSDGLGCVKENYFIVIGSIIIIFLSAKFSHYVLTYFGFGFVCFEGFITLYLPLYYVYKIHKQSSNKSPPNSLSFDLSMSQLDQHLYVFLRNKKCYMLFRQYLAHCFAIESLMFIENVVMLNRFLKIKKQSVQTDCTNLTHIAGKSLVDHICDIKFDYLSELNPNYKKYQAIINGINSFEESKQIYFNLYNAIFNTFIASDALYQVNIPYDVRYELQNIFVGSNVIDNFKNINDFLCVYHAAIMDVYCLMQNVYLFNFKQYARKQKTDLLEHSLEKLPTMKPSLSDRLSNLSKKKPSLKKAPSLSLKLQEPVIQMPKANNDIL